MGMSAQECRIEESGAEEVVRRCMKEPGVRDLEQAAEHLAANALYRIETQDITGVSYDAEDVAAVLG
jgi:ATP-dependent Lon protease